MTNKEQLRAEFKKKFSVRVEEWRAGFEESAETHEVFIYKKIDEVFNWIQENYISKEEVRKIADKQLEIFKKLNS